MRLILSVFLFFFSLQIFSQEQRAIDFISGNIYVYPKAKEKKIHGKVTYKFQVFDEVDSIFLDAKNMQFSNFNLNKEAVVYRYDGTRLVLEHEFKKGDFFSLSFDYEATPKQTVYFLGWDDEIEGNEQIWTQGQGKYTSHWLPSFDDMNTKLEFDLLVIAEDKFEVIANGRLLEKVGRDSVNAWRFDMKKPMSSYLAAFAIGNFDKKIIRSSSGVPIELYFEPKDSLKVEPTYRYTKEIFDFLEEEIGVAYPWQNYKQVPVQDFLYAGMENTGCTIFSNTYMIDSTAFVDKNYVNINAHELAHQWFGNLVTEQSGEHHWLHEGFATYYAYLAEKSLFGDDYFYWKLFKTAKTLNNLSANGDGEALTNPNANSLTFYEKGAWALAILRDRVGEVSFKEGIKNFLNRFAFKNATINDFLKEMERVSKLDLSKFRKTWLEGEEFHMHEVNAFLDENAPSIKLAHDLGQEFKTMESDDLDFKKYWRLAEGSTAFKEYLIQKYLKILPQDLIEKVLDSDQLKLRRAIAVAAQNIKPFQKEQFESLLGDACYVTIENALLKLWVSFPDERVTYLDQTKHHIGLPDKNIRLLWLALALVTPDYMPERKKQFYEELNSHTNPEYHFEVRLLAFRYLKEINAFNDNTLLNLIDTSSHHVWQFKKSSRNLLRDFVKVPENKQRLKKLEESMSDEQKKLLNKVLEP